VKDLDIFNEAYDLKDIVIIDNSVLSFIYHLENGIPIVPYYNEDKDGSLYVVGLYLMHIYKEDDLREANKKYINLDSFLKEAKERNDENSTIKEESISVENNNININNNMENNNRNNTPIKLDLNIKDMDKPEKVSQKCCSYRKNSQSISIKNETKSPYQRKLISQSKLMNMYYSINDKYKSNYSSKNIFEANKDKRNFSTDEEKEIEEIEENKNICNFYLKNRHLSFEEMPENETITFKYSNKTCCNFLDLNLVRSNFYSNFSDEENI
jgi:hypothetical protein